MSPKAKATEQEVEATVVPSTTEMSLEDQVKLLQKQLAEAQAKQVESAKQIDELQGKEEGWLLWCDNPQYDGVTGDIQFTNGQAWLPKDRELKRYARQMPSETEMQKEANEKAAFDHKTTLEDIVKKYEAVAQITSAEMAVRFLTKQGYYAKFFTKDEIAELNKMRQQRVKERAEVVAKEGTMKDYLEKLSAGKVHIGTIGG